MNSFVRDAVYNGLCDALEVAHDTGNVSAVADVVASAYEYLQAGQIDILQHQAILCDVEIYGYDV